MDDREDTPPWDRAIVALMGPIVGSIGAGVVLWAGLQWEMRSVAFAGSFGLVINLFNLIPVMPLDGGRVAANTGWFGLFPTLAVALAALYFTRSPILWALALFGLWAIYQTFRTRRSPPLRVQVSILATYLLVSLGIGLFVLLTPDVPPVPSAPPAWLPGFGDLLEFVVFNYLAGIILMPMVRRPSVHIKLRVTAMILLQWPETLMMRPAVLPGHVCIAAQMIGLPGLNWLRIYIRSAMDKSIHAQGLIVDGFVYLLEIGQAEQAVDWARGLRDDLRAVRSEKVLHLAMAQIIFLEHYREALAVLEEDGQVALPEEAETTVLNNVAWALLKEGRSEEGVHLARRAAVAEPIAAVDTLARLLLVLGEVDEARSAIEKIPEAQRTADHRAVLAQLMAAQGDFPGAVGELEEVLAGQSGTWPKDLPPKGKLLQLLDDWREGRATEPVPF